MNIKRREAIQWCEKELVNVYNKIESFEYEVANVREEERRAIEGRPESLQVSPDGQVAEDAYSELRDACILLGRIKAQLHEIGKHLENAGHL